MNNKTHVWMAVLTFTAVILGVILLSAPERRADAAMLNSQPQFSLLTTGTTGGDDMLIVVDKATHRMVVYHQNGDALDMVAAGDFGRAFVAPARGH